MEYIFLFTSVFAVGLIPAFGPPSWLFAVYFHYQQGMPFWAAVLITATATTLGRLTLAKLTKLLRHRIPKKYIDDLEYSKHLLAEKQKSFRFILGVFLLSPLPSAQLFEAAGLMNLSLLPIGSIFFVGRLVSLSFYLSFAHLGVFSLTNAWQAGFSSPLAIAGEIVTILFIVAIFNMRKIVSKLKK